MASNQRFWLAVHPPGQGDDSVWEVTADDIRQVDDIPAGAQPVYTLSEEDLRVVTDKTLSSARAKSLIRQNSGQPSRVINHSRHGVVYGRAVSNVPDAYRVAPLVVVVDQIVRARGWPDHPFVVAVVLSAGEGNNEILALWAGNSRKDLSAIQFTENAQDIERIIQAYCQQRSIPEETVVGLTLADILDALDGPAGMLGTYPRFDDWHGVPVHTLLRGAALSTGVAAAVLVGTACVLSVRGWQVNNQLSAVTTQTAQVREQIVQTFTRRLPAVIDRSSVDHRRVVKLAQALYIPGATVSVISAPGSHVFRLSVPIEPTGSSNTLALTVDTSTPTLVQAVLDQKLQGRSGTPVLSGGGNEINVEHTVKADNARLLDYLDR
jgi:hypothetical protein